MRLLVVLLLVANLGALAWWQGWLARWLPGGREPQRLERQINAQKVQLVPAAALDAAIARASAPCLDLGQLDDVSRASVETWVQGQQGASLESGAAGYRLRLPAGVSDQDLGARSTELAVLIGREPLRCAP